MDNLNSHTNPTVFALIVNVGHRILFRAPYYPVDGPIEHVFHTIQNLLYLCMMEITNMGTLSEKVKLITGALENFAPYFAHVGFEYKNK